MSDKSKGENQAENLLRAMSDHSGADTLSLIHISEPTRPF